MTGPKTNERPGTRAVLRGYRMSASKARVVLDLIRGLDVQAAHEVLALTTREAARVIDKVLASAVANAVNNDGLGADELYVSAAYADEGATLKRFSPRARGRAGKIAKRSCHITVIVSRLSEERLALVRAARSAQAAASRSRRVASSRRHAARASTAPAADEAPDVEAPLDEIVADERLDEGTAVEEPVAAPEAREDSEAPEAAEAGADEPAETEE
ncbi:MAG: 50S ribosomal protein L22 [Acidimicrobiales bacterium]